ncbi:MBG domain-containing protein [Roseivirga echinicomitans]
MKFIRLICLFSLALLSANIHAQDVIQKFSNKMDGKVNAIVVDEANGLVYLGGRFKAAGDLGSYGAVTSITDGLIKGNAFPGGTVYASYPDGKGGYYIGGNFENVGTEKRYNFAHINAQGELTDFGKDIGLDDNVRTITESNGVIYLGGDFKRVGGDMDVFGATFNVDDGIYQGVLAKLGDGGSSYPGMINSAIADGQGGFFVGGYFTHIGGVERNKLAHIAADGSITDWNPSADGEVYELALFGDRVYVLGEFTHIGSTARNFIAAIDATTGLATDWNPEVDDVLYNFAISETGETVYIAGGFTTVGGKTRNYLAAIDATTGMATDWNPNPNSEVENLAVSGNTVYAAGWFDEIGGQSRDYIAAIDATTGMATDLNLNPDDFIEKLAIAGNTLYLGGDFSEIGGEARNYLAAIDLTTGLVKSWNPNPNRSVRGVTTSNGLVYVAGYFETIGGESRNYIAALDTATGAATAWNPEVDDYVYDLVISGNKVFAEGNFSSIGGSSRKHLAAIDAATGLVTDWNPGADEVVQTLVVSGSTVYAGGEFTNIGGESRNYIAALDATTGAAMPWNPNADDMVYAITLVGSNVYVGGEFWEIGGETRKNVAVIDAATGLATAWNPYPQGSVRSIAVSADGNTVFLGGSFQYVNSVSRKFIAALDASTGVLKDWNLPGANSSVQTLAISGDKLYVGGHFTSIGGESRSRIAALDLATGSVIDWRPYANGGINSISPSGSDIYIGGQGNTIGGKERNNLAALDLNTGAVTDWNPKAIGSYNEGQVRSLALYGNELYVGGDFDNIGTKSIKYLAAIDTDTGIATDWNPNAHYSVNVLAVSDNKLYVGGEFGWMGHQSRARIASFDLTTGLLTDWDPQANHYVHSIAISGDTVYVGGQFFTIGGQARNKLAALDRNTGAVFDWNPNINGDVYSLVISDDMVYTGGSFTRVGDSIRSGLAAIDATTALATAWNPNAKDPYGWDRNQAGLVHSLAISGNMLYVGGLFNFMSGESRKHLAAFELNTGALTAWSPKPNTKVNSLALSGNTVFAGGEFTHLSNIYTRNFTGLSASKENQTLSFESLDARDYGAEPLNLTATASSNLPVSFKSSNTEVATISGNTVTIVGAGTAIITAIQLGDDRYYADSIPQNLVVNKVGLTAIAENKSKVYGAANPAFTIAYTGFVNGDDQTAITEPTASTTATAATGVGTAPITLEGGASSNYNITTNGGTLTIGKAALTATAEDKSKVYGSANPTLTIAYTGFVNGDDQSAITEPMVNTTAISSTGAGTVPITLTGGSAANYDINNVNGTLTIGKAALTATAEDKSKVYGSANPDLTIAYTGFVNGDDQSAITEPTVNTTAISSTGAGTVPITLTGGSAANYDINNVNGTLTIGKAALTVTAEDKSKTYGAANPDLTVIYSGFVNRDDKTAIIEPTISTTATATTGVGVYDITLSGGSADNYSLTTNNGSLTIGKATLTATAEDKSKVYGSANPALTIAYTGFVNGDDKSAITEPTASTTATASTGVGVYDITLSGGSADNYSLTTNNGSLTIGKAVLTATAEDKSKVYGSANPALTIAYTGFVNGDDQSAISEPTVSSTATTSTGVGVYDITLSGGSADNYSLSTNNGSLTIGKAALTATAENKSKVYGAANPALTIAYTGFVNGDDQSAISEPTASTTATASTGVGVYDITLSGGSADNYSLTTNNGSLTIGKATLTATADNKSFNKGGSLPAFTVSYTGFVNGEDASVVTTKPTASTVATSASDRGTYAITLTAGAADNYTVNTVNGTLTITGPVYTLPSSLDFGALTLGDTEVKTVEIANTGDGTLEVTGISIPAGYTIDASAFTVTNGANKSLTLTFTPTGAQTYAGSITISSNNGEEQIAITGEGQIVTGIDDERLDVSEVKLYPNPAADWLMIDLNESPAPMADLKLVNINGHTVWSQKAVSDRAVKVDVSSFTSGLYLVMVETNKGTVIKKVMIKR